MPTLGSEAYDDFIKELQDFCKKYIDYGDDRTAFDGRDPNEIAYSIYRKARDLSFKLLDDVADLPE